MVCYQITVYGKVQGVFYRASTKDKALSLDLVGWVRNQPDGTVLIEAQGPEEKVMDLVSWSEVGPEYSRVERIEKEEVEVKDYTSFEILH